MLNIIRHKPAPVLPGTTFCIEERRIDAAGNTLEVTKRYATRNREGGQRVFAVIAAINPKYRPGTGYRLVLVERFQLVVERGDR